MASEFPPGDRPANLLVEIKTRDDQEALLTVGAPIADGEPLLEVTFISQDARRIDGTIRYAARNLRAVAKCAEGVVRSLEAAGPHAGLCRCDERGNATSVALAEWDFAERAEEGAAQHALSPRLRDGTRLFDELMDILRTVLDVRRITVN